MIVIHDPSGCNSTYTTHDEPRWYDHDSLIYVSAMTERDAVLGDDHRLIEEIVTAARQQQPRFICLIPSQIAHLIGTDCRAICRILEKKTGIPAFTLRPTACITTSAASTWPSNISQTGHLDRQQLLPEVPAAA